MAAVRAWWLAGPCAHARRGGAKPSRVGTQEVRLQPEPTRALDPQNQTAVQLDVVLFFSEVLAVISPRILPVVGTANFIFYILYFTFLHRQTITAKHWLSKKNFPAPNLPKMLFFGKKC